MTTTTAAAKSVLESSMNPENVPSPGNFPVKPPPKITSITPLPEAIDVLPPAWWQRGLDFCLEQPRLAVTLFGLSVATLALATWVGALFLENKILKTQQARANAAPALTPSESADELKARISEAQQQMTELKTQLEQQQTEAMLDNRDALISENARLLQELNQLSKPQLGAPLINLPPAAVKQAEAAQGNNLAAKDPFTTLEVPHNYALFTVVLTQPQDKGFAAYFVELTDGKGKNVAWSEQVTPRNGPNLPLTFAKRSHAPGKYQLKLYGVNGKKREFLDHYDLQLNYLAEPPAKKPGRKK